MVKATRTSESSSGSPTKVGIVKALDRTLRMLRRTDARNKARTMLLTPMGLMIGDLVHPDDATECLAEPLQGQKDAARLNVSAFLRLMADSYAPDEMESAIPIIKVPEESDLVIVKDVMLRPLSNPNVSIHMDGAIVFPDAILGCSLYSREATSASPR